MADEPETPETKPAPRRRAPRKTSDAQPARKTPARREAAPKSAVEKVEDAAADAVRAPIAAAASTAKKAVKAVRPRSTNRATPRARPKKGKAAKNGAATDKVGGRWGVAAIAGGVGAAATIALLSLRGSTPRKKGTPLTDQAHQPDGTDSSASFKAGIADENTVPAEAPAPVADPGKAHQADGTDSTASFEAGIADEGTIPG